MAQTQPNVSTGATGGMSTQPDPKPTQDMTSVGEPIESRVVKKFYSDKGALMEPGQPYLYFPQKDLPYPWPLLRPEDKKLEKELKADFDDFKKDKMKGIEAAAATPKDTMSELTALLSKLAKGN